MIRQRGASLEVVVYQGRVAGKSRKVSRTIKGTDKAARLKAREVELDLMRSVAEGRAQAEGDPTVGMLLTRWLDLARVEESTRYQDRMVLDRHVRPVLGEMKLAKLKPSDLDDLYRSLERGGRRKKKLSAATVRRIHNRLHSALGTAVRWGWIARNPADLADPPTEAHSEPQAPPTEAVIGFLDLLRPEADLHAFVWLVAVTGLRRAAACALRRSDVDVEAGVVRTMRALGQGKGAPYVKGTKSGRQHELAIGAETVALLEVLIARQDKVAIEFGATLPPSAYLFSHHDDGAVPWRPDWPSKRLRTIRQAHPEFAEVTLRALRHWMITTGLDLRFPVTTVGGRASHARISTTVDKYAARLASSDRQLALSIESVLLATESDPLA